MGFLADVWRKPSSEPVVREGTAGPCERRLRYAWVPIRSLSERHRPRIVAHLRELDERDRYLRFGFAATDEQLGRYVDSLRFERDEVFGIFNRHLTLVAMAHLAYGASSDDAHAAPVAEFGGSVLGHYRGRGFGAKLFEHAMLHARNRGVATLYIQALSENTVMLRIARNAGATVERGGSEAQAWLALPPDTLASQVDEFVELHAAEADYQWKANTRLMSRALGTIGEVAANIPFLGKASAPPDATADRQEHPHG